MLRLLVEGQTNQEIALTLSISPHTVAHHVAHILNKLGFSRRSQVAAWAVEQGLAAHGLAGQAGGSRVDGRVGNQAPGQDQE